MIVAFVAAFGGALIAVVAREAWRRRPKSADLTIDDFYITPASSTDAAPVAPIQRADPSSGT